MDQFDATPVSVPWSPESHSRSGIWMSVSRTTIPVVANHYNITPVVDVLPGL